MKNAVGLYIDSSYVTVDTFYGIFNLVDHINNLNITSNDSVYYIYDNIPENTDIPLILVNAKKLIKQHKYSNRINLLPILCCEYSLLTADNIEMFCQKKHIEIVLKLKKLSKSSNLTLDTKNEPIFNYLYDRARNEHERKLKSRGKIYTKNDIEKAVTVEKLCKKMLAEVFQNELHITNTFGGCWEKDCCIKNTRICNIGPNNRKFNALEKKQYLVDYTIYIRLLNEVKRREGIKLKTLNTLNIDDIILIKSVRQLINSHNPEFINAVKRCKSNLESHCQNGYSLKEAQSKCEKDGFTNDEIECAITELLT